MLWQKEEEEKEEEEVEKAEEEREERVKEDDRVEISHPRNVHGRQYPYSSRKGKYNGSGKSCPFHKQTRVYHEDRNCAIFQWLILPMNPCKD